MVGLWDLEPQQWRGQVHLLGGDNGLWSSWTAEDGALHILCANTSAHSGWEGPSNAAHYRFDGSTLEELASWDYYDEDYKAVPREGGLDLYSFNPQYEFQFHNPDYSGVPSPASGSIPTFSPSLRKRRYRHGPNLPSHPFLHPALRLRPAGGGSHP